MGWVLGRNPITHINRDHGSPGDGDYGGSHLNGDLVKQVPPLDGLLGPSVDLLPLGIHLRRVVPFLQQEGSAQQAVSLSSWVDTTRSHSARQAGPRWSVDSPPLRLSP